MPTNKASHKQGTELASVLQLPLGRGAPDNEQKYRTLFERASDAILVVRIADQSQDIDDVNQACEEMTGYLKSELVGTPASGLSPDPSTHRIPDRTRPFHPGLLSGAGTYEDIAVLRKDGYVRLVDLSVRVLEDGREGGSCLSVALFRDVTEKKRMERELITKHHELRNAFVQLEKKNAELESMQQALVQAGKMAALGELAAGIAHELNQPLQGIRGYAQEIEHSLVSGATQAPLSELREIISGVDKMAGIIDHMRAFIRKGVEKHEMTDVHAAIEEALKMLGRQFVARGIELQRGFSAGLPKIYANPLQLEQVFINLATNARDAIEATGRGSGKVEISTRVDGQFVEVRFRDNGVGMSEKTKAKAFNPFFTTKEVGKGMGLGLSLSYGMVSKLHGSIIVESELGKGTEFRIRLPRDFRELG